MSVCPSSNTAVYDLQNTVTHEFGHFLGLEHTCFVPGTVAPDLSADGKMRPKDDQGNDVPDCKTAPQVIKDTVMFYNSDPLETKKRVLAADDARAVCEIYAPAIAHVECALDSANPSCAVAAVPPPAARRARIEVRPPLGRARGARDPGGAPASPSRQRSASSSSLRPRMDVSPRMGLSGTSKSRTLAR